MNYIARPFGRTCVLCAAAALLAPSLAIAQQEVSNGERYDQTQTITVPGGVTLGQANFTVPAGKRLVVRNVSGLISSTRAERFLIDFATFLGNTIYDHYIPLSAGTSQTNEYGTVFNVPTYFNAGPGGIALTMQSPGLPVYSFASITVSGYLVDIGHGGNAIGASSKGHQDKQHKNAAALVKAGHATAPKIVAADVRTPKVCTAPTVAHVMPVLDTATQKDDIAQ